MESFPRLTVGWVCLSMEPQSPLLSCQDQSAVTVTSYCPDSETMFMSSTEKKASYFQSWYLNNLDSVQLSEDLRIW